MKGKLCGLVTIVILLATVVVFVSGCTTPAYTQTIKISVENEGVNGLLVKIACYQDSRLASSIHLIDGNGDTIIDGKSGPSKEGQWPKGWNWFDDLYRDITVGSSTIEIVGEKIRVQASTTYEFLPGEYECVKVG